VSWPVILTLAEIAWILVAGTAIVLQRRSATATVAWVLAVALLPVVGFIIYWLIGPQRLKRTKLARVASAQQVAAAMAGLEEAKLSAPEHARLALVPLGLGEARRWPPTRSRRTSTAAQPTPRSARRSRPPATTSTSSTTSGSPTASAPGCATS
jgi:hypothetical protein